MSSDQPLSVKERIAALQKNAASNATSTSTSGAGIKGEGVGGRKKVSALAGDLSSKLNMNALLAGGAGGKRPSSGNNHVAVAVADPSHSAQAIMTTAKAKDDKATGIVGEGYLHHPPRAMIPPGRRRRRGAF